jgi:flagellar hook-basal body complex protein FliE
MTPPISSPTTIAPIEPVRVEGQSPADGQFHSVLHSAIQQVETSRAAADSAAQDFLVGKSQELHSTILATQKAALEFESFLQVRNKVVSAYEEIMRMQI